MPYVQEVLANRETREGSTVGGPVITDVRTMGGLQGEALEIFVGGVRGLAATACKVGSRMKYQGYYRRPRGPLPQLAAYSWPTRPTRNTARPLATSPVARHTPSWRTIYASAALSAPIRCGTPMTNGRSQIAMTCPDC